MQEPKTEAEVLALFKRYKNVAESWTLYDSILICNTFYGAENQVQGWFSTFQDFASHEQHIFFKSRTEAIAGGAYTNQQSSDTMDFAFLAYSMGIAIWAPAPNLEGTSGTQIEGASGVVDYGDPSIGHFFQFDLPRHMGIQFRTNQDIRAECTCYAAPPGYGPIGGGAASEIPETAIINALPVINIAGTQGVPVLQNRFKFPIPIGIPRTATIEGILKVSPYARYVLEGITGPQYYVFQADGGGPPFEFFPKRYGIQFSILGKRLVQQRAQYHA